MNITRNELLDVSITLQQAARHAKAMQAEQAEDGAHDFYCGIRNGLGLALREVQNLLDVTARAA